jgi:hypothetical protein
MPAWGKEEGNFSQINQCQGLWANATILLMNSLKMISPVEKNVHNHHEISYFQPNGLFKLEIKRDKC